jgi:hypothetical protein
MRDFEKLKETSAAIDTFISDYTTSMRCHMESLEKSLNDLPPLADAAVLKQFVTDIEPTLASMNHQLRRLMQDLQTAIDEPKLKSKYN